MKQLLKQDKGVAGLTILLSIIVLLFVIGLLVMVFSLMSGEMADQDILYERTSEISVGTEAISLTDAGVEVANANAGRDTRCTFVAIYNDTTLLGSGNVTESAECTWKNNTYYTTWKINYTYNYLADEHGTVEAINDTSTSLAGVTDWFGIFIVISAMVVLILLTVIIITAIRSSGMVAGASSGANQVGTA